MDHWITSQSSIIIIISIIIIAIIIIIISIIIVVIIIIIIIIFCHQVPVLEILEIKDKLSMNEIMSLQVYFAKNAFLVNLLKKYIF